jgi:hypothetical protein
MGIISDRADIVLLEPVVDVHTGNAGRPEKNIDSAFLADALSPKRNISLKALAKSLDIHRNTLRQKIKACGLSKEFDKLSSADLDTLIRDFKATKPNSGHRYAMGYLRQHGFRVQKKRVAHSLRRVDGLGQVLRKHKAIRRRKYTVPRPNHLWHCDGHHKLIWWGIVIHGFIDGYCRTVSEQKTSKICIESFHAFAPRLLVLERVPTIVPQQCWMSSCMPFKNTEHHQGCVEIGVVRIPVYRCG